MSNTIPRRCPRFLLAGALLAALVLLPTAAFAAAAGGGAAMPWTGPLQSLLNNLSGPTARIIASCVNDAISSPLARKIWPRVYDMPAPICGDSWWYSSHPSAATGSWKATVIVSGAVEIVRCDCAVPSPACGNIAVEIDRWPAALMTYTWARSSEPIDAPIQP